MTDAESVTKPATPNSALLFFKSLRTFSAEIEKRKTWLAAFIITYVLYLWGWLLLVPANAHLDGLLHHPRPGATAWLVQLFFTIPRLILSQNLVLAIVLMLFARGNVAERFKIAWAVGMHLTIIFYGVRLAMLGVWTLMVGPEHYNSVVDILYAIPSAGSMVFGSANPNAHPLWLRWLWPLDIVKVFALIYTFNLLTKGFEVRRGAALACIAILVLVA